jgi:flagellum-specific peptidoglycan hydrolase FlgJ/LysM repeat protein
MRIVTTSFILLALLAQSCDVLKKIAPINTTPNASSKKSTEKGIDRTTMTERTVSASAVASAPIDRNLNYVQRFNQAAVIEMERVGIPASITLAQGILESSAGTSELARQANNHFGIKCGGNWNGKTFYRADDDRDDKGNIKESCFRKYETVEQSYLDHGEFLKDPKKTPRYGYLFNLDRTDYKSWAHGLQAAGYATSLEYATSLIDLIERYHLDEYDLPGPKNTPTSPMKPSEPDLGVNTTPSKTDDNDPSSTNERVGRVNDTKVVATKPGESLEDIARTFGVNTQKIVEYNDRGYKPNVALNPNTRVYIQSKKDQWGGRATEHTVREKQSMFEIAQLYGIKLESLLARNGLVQGQEPATNERVRLRKVLAMRKPIKLRDDSNSPGSLPTTEGESTPPKSNSMVNDDDLDFEITPSNTKPGQANTQNEEKTKPSTPVNKPPATSDVPFPGDPRQYNPDPNPSKPQTTTDEEPVQQGYHRIVKGDTLYKLSRDYGIPVARIKQLNNMTNDDIKIGQILRVQ